jgi:PAS domain S-box-containing protein
MQLDEKEEALLRSVALQNARTVLLAREQAERELVLAKEALERKTEELSRDREWFKVTLSSIGDAVITTDMEGKVTFLNPVAEALTGWDLNDAVGSPLEEIFHIVQEVTRRKVENPVSKALREKRVVDLANHTVLISRNGGERAIEDSAAPIKDATGLISGAVMVFHDVTARRQAQEALRRSEEKLRATFDQAAVGIVILRLDGRVEQSNQRLEEILGYPREELEQRTLLELTFSEDLQSTLENARRLIEGRVPSYVVEKRYNRKDGATVWCRTTVTLLKDSFGNPNRLIGVIEDIQQRKTAEEALQRSEQFNRTIIESSRDCIQTLSLDGTMLWMDDTGLKTLGIKNAEEVRGKSWVDFWREEERPMARAAVEAAASGGTGNFAGNVVSQGQSKWWEVVITPIWDSSRPIQQLLAISRDITGRKREEETQSRLAAVVESSDDAILSMTLEAVITTWNKGAERMFGYKAQEVVGKPVILLLPPDRIDEEPAILERLKRGERVEHYETLRVHKDGTFLNVSLTVSPIQDKNGRIVGVSKSLRDITERKRWEEVLQEETRILELLNKTGKAIAAELDLQRLVQTVTDAATELSGAEFGAFFYNTVNEQGESFVLYTLSGAPREAFEKFGLPRNTPVFNPTFKGEGVVRSADITKDPRYGKMEPHHGMPKGHLPVRSYLAVSVTSRSGEVIGGLFFGHPAPNVFTERSERLIVGVAAQAAIAIDNARLYTAAQKEIAERKAAEAALRESEQRFRTLADAAPVLIWVAGVDKLHTWFNKAWLLFTGRSLEAELGDGWAENVHPDDLGRHQQIYHRSFNAHQPFELEYRMRRGGGNYRWILERAVPRFGMDGTFQGYVGGCVDIDDQKRAEEKLEQAVLERTAALRMTIGELEAFSYSISHDMRAPLRAMQSFALILEEECAPQISPQGKQYLRRIVSAAERLDQLIQDVLTYSRVVRMEMDLQPVNLGKLLREILEVYPMFQRPEVAIELEGNFPLVLGNEAILTQCISNLLGNAIKFVAPGVKPCVRVWAESADTSGKIRLLFADNGVGIEDSAHQKIFEIFQRVSKRYEGTGIGLSIVKKGIERMGGSVGLKSKPGKGSVFWLELIRAEMEEN